MVVTQPFNYGNVLANVEGIKGQRLRNQFTEQTMDQRTNALARQEELNNALASGDYAAASAIDPVATQQYSARQMGLAQTRAPILVSALDKVMASANPYQRAQSLLPELEDAGINTASFRQFLAGAPTRESILEGAGQMREGLASMYLQPQEPEQGASDPAAVREYQFYQQLTPEEQRQYLAVKRAQQVISQPGIGTGVLQADQSVAPVVTEAQTQQAIAERRRAESQARAEGTQAVQDRSRLPDQIARDEATIADIDMVIDAIESGQLQTGPIAGQFPALSDAAQKFDMITGKQIVNLISSATFGQLSEGERKFIAGIAASRKKNESVNLDELRQLRKLLKGASERARKKIGQSEQGGMTLPGGSKIEFVDE